MLKITVYLLVESKYGGELWKIMCMCIFFTAGTEIMVVQTPTFSVFKTFHCSDFSLAHCFKAPKLYDAVCFYALLLHHHALTLCIVCRIGSKCFYTMLALIFEEFALSHTRFFSPVSVRLRRVFEEGLVGSGPHAD